MVGPYQGEDAGAEHQPVLFDGTLPAATGNVAQKISATNIATQRQQAEDFYNYLALQTSDHLLQINEGTTPLIALINVPTSKEVKLLYCAGIGASLIGNTSPLDGKFLSLHGEGGNDLGNPDTLVLPGSIRTKVDVLTMTATQFSTALTEKGANYSHPLLARARVAETSSLMQISPIPPLLVYDGFEKIWMQPRSLREFLQRIRKGQTCARILWRFYEHVSRRITSTTINHTLSIQSLCHHQRMRGDGVMRNLRNVSLH